MPRIRWFVYVVRCADRSLYTGIARDVAKRLAAHSKGTGSRCLSGRLPILLVHQEVRFSRSAALKREAAIKRLTRVQKEALILKKDAEQHV